MVRLRDVGHGQHGHDRQHFFTALVFDRCDDELCKRGVHGEGRHGAAQRGEVPDIVQGTEGPEVEEGRGNHVLRRRIHEVEV